MKQGKAREGKARQGTQSNRTQHNTIQRRGRRVGLGLSKEATGGRYRSYLLWRYSANKHTRREEGGGRRLYDTEWKVKRTTFASPVGNGRQRVATSLLFAEDRGRCKNEFSPTVVCIVECVDRIVPFRRSCGPRVGSSARPMRRRS